MSGKQDIKLLCSVVNQVKNQRIRQCGYSAYQWTFGRDPDFPDVILSGGTPDLEAVAATTADQELEKRIGHDELLQAHLNRSFTLYKPPIALRKTGATRRVDHKTRNTGPHLGATTRVEHKKGVYDVPAPIIAGHQQARGE